MRLAAGLRPDPLEELKRSPDPLAAIRGPTSKGRGGKGGKTEGGEGKRGERRGREEGREGDDFRHSNPEMLPAPLSISSS